MTVQNFMEYFIDPDAQKFEVWDNNEEKIIFSGYLSETPDALLDAEITSIDNLSGSEIITLNVDF